jgi:ribosomal protein S18 acetylase RimI-like enzyme
MSEIQELIIRNAQRNDLALILDITGKMGSRHDAAHYEQSLDLQEAGERAVLLAFCGEKVAGFVMLSWAPKYAYYRAEGIPEIQDLNVLPGFRQRGYGRAMISYCEDLVRVRGYRQIGIGVGLTPSYGAAQRLYVKMGYVPDGFGVTYDRQIVRAGEFRPIDDEMSLMMVKKLV